MKITGAEYIVQFLEQKNLEKIFLVTGGACAFIVDAIARSEKLKYFCFHHEQSAAMAADAVWRVSRKPGVTLSTSGPGATNLLTGIACSFFDSIPSIHITGQVNLKDNALNNNANPRQKGFQETNIVDMVKPITKYSTLVTDINSLPDELEKAYSIATTGRMGPVLIDIPMNIQKETFDLISSPLFYAENNHQIDSELLVSISIQIQEKLSQYERPLVVYGAGVGLAGVEEKLNSWLHLTQLPFVSSWGACGFVDHQNKNYLGNLGVYGDRCANFAVQNADCLIVLGSRLDSRQRSGNPAYFAPHADIFVFDIDAEELKKYDQQKYTTFNIDLKNFAEIFNFNCYVNNENWQTYLQNIKKEFFHKNADIKKNESLSPYAVIRKLSHCIDENAIVSLDIGANTAWFYQSFVKEKHTVFTAGGMAPMGYGLPAAIGAALESPSRQVICVAGDGGIQMNIQELQFIVHHNLNIKIIILNNFGYGMIKQFQDAYFQGRYEASDKGYSCPDFSKIANAYGIPSFNIINIENMTGEMFLEKGPLLLNVILPSDSMITPKLEVNKYLHDQFPYLSLEALKAWNPYFIYEKS